MSSSGSAEGFLLLTLPNCTLTTPSTTPQTGHLAVQCVTLDIPSASPADRDVWLVLKLNTFEMVVSPTQRINYSRSMHTYMFLPEVESDGLVQVVVPPNPSNSASYQDLETMEVILSQYGVLHDSDGPSSEKEKSGYVEMNSDAAVVSRSGTSDFKGRLVLMDEEDGEVVATLDESVSIKEDKTLAEEGRAKDPVVVDLPGEEEERTEAYVHPASPEERDMLMQTAGLISRGIILATSAMTTGIASVSNYYISHSTPTSQPVEFSPRTRANMRRMHRVSGAAVTVTSKTTGAILKTLDLVADKVTGSSSNTSHTGRRTGTPQLAPPPLPPRGGSPGISPPGTPRMGSPSLPPRKPRLLNRLLASTDLLLTTLEHSANDLIESGTDAVSASLAHKYGQHVGDASKMAGQSVRNVGLVYIDVRGVGRRALLKRAGKAVVKARMGGRDVVIGPQGMAMPGETDFGQPAVSHTPSGPTTSLPDYSWSAKGGTPPAGKSMK